MTEHPAAPGLLLPATTTTDHDAVHAAVAVLPIGAFEQHDPSLPLVTDTLIAIAIAEAISQHHKVFQLPALWYLLNLVKPAKRGPTTSSMLPRPRGAPTTL